MKPMNKLTKQDWIVIRMLYYATATDPSSVTVKDVARTQEYAVSTYGLDTLLAAYELIRKEHASNHEYDNPASLSMRNLKTVWHRQVEWENAKELGAGWARS